MKYIDDRMIGYAMNISTFKIGQTFTDKKGSIGEITNMTRNTIQVFVKRQSKEGIDCFKWIGMMEFNDIISGKITWSGRK